jgi:hypothetical protein
MSLEAPDADAAEQQQDAVPADTDDQEPDQPEQTPLEADPADAAEQARELDRDDDDYR